MFCVILETYTETNKSELSAATVAADPLPYAVGYWTGGLRMAFHYLASWKLGCSVAKARQMLMLPLWRNPPGSSWASEWSKVYDQRHVK